MCVPIFIHQKNYVVWLRAGMFVKAKWSTTKYSVIVLSITPSMFESVKFHMFLHIPHHLWDQKTIQKTRCTPKIGCIITMAGSVIGSIAYIYNLSPTMQMTCSTLELQFVELRDLGLDAIEQTKQYLCHTMQFNMSAPWSLLFHQPLSSKTTH